MINDNLSYLLLTNDQCTIKRILDLQLKEDIFLSANGAYTIHKDGRLVNLSVYHEKMIQEIK